MTARKPHSDDLGLARLPEDDLPPSPRYVPPEEPEVSVEEMIIPPPRADGENLDRDVQQASQKWADGLLKQAEKQREEERLKNLTPPIQITTNDIMVGVTAACVGLAIAIAPLGGVFTGLMGGLAFTAILAVMVIQPHARGWYVAAFSLLGAYLAALTGKALVMWLRG